MDSVTVQDQVEICGRTEELAALIDARNWRGALRLLSQLGSADETGLPCELDREGTRAYHQTERLR
ncbi:MAG TPA: hypothetical protein ENL12_01995, partial [Dehalococcoidia bacterium]|nr:hypothetical protein [Dehalococcoidia bacterium]